MTLKITTDKFMVKILQFVIIVEKNLELRSTSEHIGMMFVMLKMNNVRIVVKFLKVTTIYEGTSKVFTKENIKKIVPDVINHFKILAN